MEKLGRNSLCWCGSGKKYKSCHGPIEDKIEQFRRQGAMVPDRDILKTPEQIRGIRKSALINIAVLDYVAEKICAGMSTEEIDRLVYEKTTELGGIPAPLNYQGFPKSVCTSRNDQVCHGIPSEEEILQEGDIINVDVSTICDGYFSDSSRMFCIGEVSPEREKLVRVARECVIKGLEQVRPWGFLGDIGQAVYDHAHANGCTVVREIGGHGIGLEFHEDPWVGYCTRKGTDMLLVPGMCFTIEPMINAGRAEIFQDEDNGWTIYTEDGMDSAQWEIQVLVTEEGCEILTY